MMQKRIVDYAQKSLGFQPDDVPCVGKAANNKVYTFAANGKRYIIKFYRSKEWPEAALLVLHLFNGQSVVMQPTIALNHVGLLVVDEIQNVVNSKNGKSLIGMLTQLINNSGISICMVGTPESTVFFEQAMQLARRSLGLQYGKLECDAYFCGFCRALYEYQYVRHRTAISPAIIPD